MQHQTITSNRYTVCGAQTDDRFIVIEVRSVYGELKAYPQCQRARLFADIAGTRTLTQATLNMVGALGFEIVSMANADWSKVR